MQLETAKEIIRQYQELDENDFHFLYQRAFDNNMSKQSQNDQVHSLSLKFVIVIVVFIFSWSLFLKYRKSTDVDSFVQLNLKPDINIRLEDYKKVNIFYSIEWITLSVRHVQERERERSELILLFFKQQKRNRCAWKWQQVRRY